MAGTWDVFTQGDPLGAPPAVMAFDEAGNFIGGPTRSNLCADYNLMYGTYALGSGTFQLTSTVGMGGCGWWLPAEYAATFGATCDQLALIRVSDPCNGLRGYFDQPTTLTRRTPPAASP